MPGPWRTWEGLALQDQYDTCVSACVASMPCMVGCPGSVHQQMHGAEQLSLPSLKEQSLNTSRCRVRVFEHASAIAAQLLTLCGYMARTGAAIYVLRVTTHGLEEQPVHSL